MHDPCGSRKHSSEELPNAHDVDLITVVPVMNGHHWAPVKDQQTALN